MKQSKKSLGMKISAFVLSFAMVCTLLAGVNVVAFAADDSDDSLTDTVSVLRAYNPNNGEHLMTVDETEYNANVARGYSAEGEKWKAPLESKSPVYRVYNPNSGEHLLLATEAEYNATVAAGWEGEGVKMYSDDNKGVPIYRLFNPNAHDAGSHHYCEKEEADGLVAIGWKWDLNGEPAIYGVKGEEPQVVVNLTDAKQLSANTIEVKFDQAATGLVTKEDITVAKADGTLTIPVNNMTLSEDGMSAVLELAVALQDKTEYAVSLNESVSNFTASVGEVASVALKTSTAQQNVETPIEFTLYDATGVDVTSTVNVDNTCSVTVEGNVTSNTDKASKSTITMDTVGDKATVTITYNAGELDSKDVTTQGVITCIEPEAEVGQGVYADVDPDSDTLINAESKCAKFYWGPAVIKTSAVTVEENESNDGIFFCAAKAVDPDGVIAYDSYTVTSSNEDVMSVTADVDSGKFAQMTVTGNTVGSANIVITATKNGKDTPYTIPVTVTKTGVLKSVNYTVSRKTMTNAIDEDYYGVATAYGVDSNNNVVDDADVTFSVVDFEKKGGTNDDIDDNYYNALSGKGLIAQGDSGFRLVGSEDGGETVAAPLGVATYTAQNAKGGSRSLKATVSEGEIVKEKSTSISVQALPDNIWNNEVNKDKDGVKLTYSVELESSTITTPSAPTTARLAAYYGGKFVGYVRQAGDDVTVGSSMAGESEDGVAYLLDAESHVVASFTAVDMAGDVDGLQITMVNTKVEGQTGASITVTKNDEGTPTGLTYAYGKGTVDGDSYVADYVALVKDYLASGDEQKRAAAVVASFFIDDEGFTSPMILTGEAIDGAQGIVMGGYEGFGSSVKIDPTTELSGIKVGVKYGNKYSKAPIPGFGYAFLYDGDKNMTNAKPEDTWNEEGVLSIVAFKPTDGAAKLVSGDSKFDENFARPGSYTVEFTYKINGKDSKASTNLTVKNGLTQMIPAVNVKDRNVDSLDEGTIIENMSTLVDMNNNTSSHESIKDLGSFDKNGNWVDINPGDNSVNVKYAVVDDVIGGILIHFYVPVNKTFYLK